MRTIEQSTQFRRDLKREAKGLYRHALKSGFVAILEELAKDGALPERFCDHPLTGNWRGHRECHIFPDLLLIYQKVGQPDGGILRLVRLGSHSELF